MGQKNDNDWEPWRFLEQDQSGIKPTASDEPPSPLKPGLHAAFKKRGKWENWNKLSRYMMLRSVATSDGLLREYTSEKHARQLLDGIGDVFQARQFTDCVIKIGDTEMKAHKCILSASSKYFRAMFTTDLKEGQTDTVELKDVDEQCVVKVINFIYTGRIQIVTEKVESLLGVADMFDLQEVREACTDTLIRNLCPDNCINMANLAAAHNLTALSKAALKYAHENVETVLQSQEFLKSPITQVKALLSSDELNVKSELTVFDGVLRWIKHDKGSRQHFIEDLFGLIRLSIIPVADLIERVSNEDVINTNTKCRDMLNKAMEEYHQSLKNPSTRKPSRFGAKAGHLFCLGGEGAESRVEVYHPNVNRWERGKVDMLVGRSGAMAVSHGGKAIFIIGGQDKRKRPLNSVDVYDVRMKNWKSLSSMYEQRVYGAATIIEGNIYVAGGCFDRTILMSAEFYNVENDIWNRMSSMTQPRARWSRQHFIEDLFGLIRLSIIPVADLIERVSNEDVINTNTKCRDMLNKAMEEYHQSLKNPSTRKPSRFGAKAGHLFCLGGEGAESRVEVYHPNVNRWERGKVDMLVGRSGAMAVSHGGKAIFIIGGQDKRKRPLNSVDVYDVRMKNWKSLSSMYEQRVYGAATIIEGNIYVAGGCFDRTILMSAEFYNVENDIWNRMSSMTQPRARCGCATVDGNISLWQRHTPFDSLTVRSDRVAAPDRGR
eukprot:sb/3462532/